MGYYAGLLTYLPPPVHPLALRHPDQGQLVVGPGAVGVVVAVLGAHPLVAAVEQRRAMADQQSGEHVAHLLALEGLVVPVAAAVVVLAALVVAPHAERVVAADGVEQPAPVLLLVVAEQVVHREAVVHGHEVDAVPRLAPVPGVDVRAAGQHCTTVDAFCAVQVEVVVVDEAAPPVTEVGVPLEPAVLAVFAHGEAADAWACARGGPWLGDDPGVVLLEDRVVDDVLEDGLAGIDVAVVVEVLLAQDAG